MLTPRTEIIQIAEETHFENYETIAELIHICDDDEELSEKLNEIMERKSLELEDFLNGVDVTKRTGTNAYKRLQKDKTQKTKRALALSEKFGK